MIEEGGDRGRREATYRYRLSWLQMKRDGDGGCWATVERGGARKDGLRTIWQIIGPSICDKATRTS